MSSTSSTDATREKSGSPLEVLRVFLQLGLTSFGGPIAHIGYFRNAFVIRRRWLDEQSFADIVSLCQFLPGPASSQVGFSIGLMRAGALGGLAAWTGFTLPSAILLVAFAYGAHAITNPLGLAALHGLRLVAVAIVAQAVWGMARTLAPDIQRAAIAIVAAIVLAFSSAALAQAGAIVGGGIAGYFLCRAAPVTTPAQLKVPVSRTVAFVCLALFALILLGLPLLIAIAPSQTLALFAAFYRAGALVFGGGHVVLPLLREGFVAPGWVSQDNFLSGYGAAQAVPGPLFTFAAYLGAVARPEPHAIAGAALGLFGIFLPGLLIVTGTLPFWDSFRTRIGAQAIMRGINAAVVGLLAAALYALVSAGNTVGNWRDATLAAAGFGLLIAWRLPPLIVVIGTVAASVALASLAWK